MTGAASAPPDPPSASAPGETLGRSRSLLRQMRDIMAGGGTPQQRLDAIVAAIAIGMGAEVCSVYVIRPGEILELFATIGLKREAVHFTRLRLGEGLVGEIAARRRPLALSDAPSHPNFAYRPETGEELYRSLLGVPLLHGERAIGVLVVQNSAWTDYTDEQVETLETIAMVVAELTATGILLSPEQIREVTAGALPARIEGLRFNPGIAIGTAVLHRLGIEIRQLVAEDPEAERRRLAQAVETMQAHLETLLNSSDIAHGGEHRDVLETYRMFAADRGWLRRIDEAISSGLSAEAAVERVRRDSRLRMEQVRDPYLRERLADIEDLANRLLRTLTLPAVGASPMRALPDQAILCARSLGPGELLDYDRTKLKGIVIEEGSATAHVSIIARALDIPMVGRAHGVLAQVEAGDPVIVDGDHGQVFLRPSTRIRDAVSQSIAQRARQVEASFALRGLPGISRDGVAVSLMMNAGLLVDLDLLDASGAEGIGLYRTEIPFMVRPAFPGVEEQRELYRKVLTKAAGKPVVFRLLDAGGDKRLPYWQDMEEENPAMGWRAIRVAIDRPAILRLQLRALIQAAAGQPLSILVPMVSEASEFFKVQALLRQELARAESAGLPPPAPLKLGCMLEVPALAFHLDALLPVCDFIAIGSNDLCQFTFAADRGNPYVAQRYDPLSPPFLSLLRMVIERCRAAGRPVSVCGEMAGAPLDAMVLVGLGVRTLSMPPSGIAGVKAMVRSLDVRGLAGLLREILSLPDHSLRGRLQAFANDHGVTT